MATTQIKLSQLIELSKTHRDRAKALLDANVALAQQNAALWQDKSDLNTALADALSRDAADASTVAAAQIAAQTSAAEAAAAQEALAAANAQIAEFEAMGNQIEEAINELTAPN